MPKQANKANPVSVQLHNLQAELINKQHAAVTVQVKSPVCERTCGVLGKGGFEEAD